jgi:signal recognition particle GTPase
VPVTETFQLPVKFVGLGEQADDMAVFDPQRYLDALLAGSFASTSV